MKKHIIPALIFSAILVSCGEPETMKVTETEKETITTVSETVLEEKTETATETAELSTEPEQTTTEEKTGQFALYDENGIKITHKRTGEMSNCLAIEVEIENTTDQDLVIQTKDFNVNDYMTRAAFSTEVLAGKKAVGRIRIMDEELQKNGMERSDIEKVEFRFTFNSPSFENVFDDSDIIVLNYK